MNLKRIEPDLLIINILTAAFILVVFTDSAPWLRVVLGILMIILFPGYVLLGALYPRKDSLSRINRLALSLGLSIVVIVLIGLALNYLPWGIRLHSLSISFSVFVLLLSAVAWCIRRRYHPDERYGITFKPPGRNLTDYFRFPSWAHLGLIIIIVCSLIGFTVVLSYMLTKPPERQPFTEFYILGIENQADNYPLQLRLGEEGSVIVGLVNHEGEETDYRIEVIAGGNKLYDLFPIILKAEESWHRELKFTPEQVVKRQKVEFRLSKDGEQPSEVRYLWINVKA